MRETWKEGNNIKEFEKNKNHSTPNIEVMHPITYKDAGGSTFFEKIEMIKDEKGLVELIRDFCCNYDVNQEQTWATVNSVMSLMYHYQNPVISYKYTINNLKEELSPSMTPEGTFLESSCAIWKKREMKNLIWCMMRQRMKKEW